MVRWDKQLIDHALFLFKISYRLRALKSLYLYLYKIMKQEENELK